MIPLRNRYANKCIFRLVRDNKTLKELKCSSPDDIHKKIPEEVLNLLEDMYGRKDLDYLVLKFLIEEQV